MSTELTVCVRWMAVYSFYLTVPGEGAFWMGPSPTGSCAKGLGPVSWCWEMTLTLLGSKEEELLAKSSW